MLDADVLVPVLVCDLLLSIFDAELLQPAVSSTILEEVERSLIVDFPRLDPDGLRRRVDGMARALALHVHDVTQENDAALAGINRKDRHVAALALNQHADLVVTNDRRLRREINARSMPLRALSADEFVLRLVLDDRTQVDDVIDELVTKRQRRPVTRAALLDQLARRRTSCHRRVAVRVDGQLSRLTCSELQAVNRSVGLELRPGGRVFS